MSYLDRLPHLVDDSVEGHAGALAWVEVFLLNERGQEIAIEGVGAEGREELL